MRKRVVSGLLAGAAGLLTLPGVAFAQSQAYTNSPVNLYAGPADDYPAVSQLPPGAPVTVMGCVSGYSWCDVAAPDVRGWIDEGRKGRRPHATGARRTGPATLARAVAGARVER